MIDASGGRNIIWIVIDMNEKVWPDFAYKISYLLVYSYIMVLHDIS